MVTLPMRHGPGFTLVEVLVTLIVVAVGLLGLSALLSTGLRFNTSAVYRSQATNMAYFIIDCMQANRAQAIAPNNAYVSPVESPAPECTAGTISALAGNTIAAQDLDLWRKTLACLLPQGTGAIVGNASQTNSFTITVQWDDSRGQRPVQQFTTTAGL